GDAWLDPHTTAERMTQLRDAAELAERPLRQHLALPTLPVVATDTTELAKALPDDGVLVAFSEGMSGDLARMLVAGDKPVPDDWYAFVMTKAGKASMRRIGSIKATSAQAHAWYERLRDSTSSIDTQRSEGLKLRHILLDGLISENGQTHLFIVP